MPRLFLCALAASAVARQPERTPLAHVRVKETSGSTLARAALTFGVPLAPGALASAAAAASLRVWRASDGAPLPAQARALSTGADGRVRWALVDTQVALQARAELELVIGLAPDIPETASPWQVEWDPAAGRAAVTDGATRWPVLARDPQGDAVLGLRPWLVDRFGHAYRGELDPTSARLLEQGPLRLCVEVRGAHRRVDETGLPIDFHDFTARVHLLAGTRTARVEWTLHNGPLLEPPGPLAFRSYELLLDAGAGALGVDVPGALPAHQGAFALRQDGPAAVLCDYRVDGASLGVTRVADLWGGLPSAAGAPGGAYVLRVDSARNHPAGLRWQRGGPLRVGLLPETPGTEFWLDDATQKTFRLVVARDVGPEGRGLMLAAASPPAVALDPRELAASGAWGDTGLFHVPELAELRAAPAPPRDPPTGWADWGEWNTRNTHSTGSPRNRLSVFLEAVQSGSAELFDLALARARHAMDLRPFHIAGFSAQRLPHANLYEGVPHVNEPPENRLGRTEMAQRFGEYKTGLPAKGHGYNGFDGEHMTLDDVYEAWLLTGDWVAHEALAQAGEAMLTWHTVMPDHDLHSARSFGWTLRALCQVFRATGDRRMLDACRQMTARADERRGKGQVKYFRAGPPDARHIADQASESPWMVAVALHGLCAYWNETHDPLVPPMLRDLSTFILAAYRGADGFVADLPVLGPLTGGRAHEPLGTSQWVPGALAAAAFVTGDHAPVDAVYGYYRALRTRTSTPLQFGAPGWHWWQAYLVSLRQRHGDAAVRNPAGFVMPGR